ncbi:uncharacterized protein LOC143863544 [Tasmannia lanceolata]|uniref:uncharacterized protein LOC143863544 n=1 Tax=Tasmannia lanceolata TaxID=3420 RepID=UPI004063E049
MASVRLLRELGYMVLKLILYVLLNTWIITQVYQARLKYNVPYLTLYAQESENNNTSLFNCIQRGHQMPIFFVLLLLGGFHHPLISKGLGVFYLVNRYFNFTGYSTGDPDNRLKIGSSN